MFPLSMNILLQMFGLCYVNECVCLYVSVCVFLLGMIPYSRGT